MAAIASALPAWLLLASATALTWRAAGIDAAAWMPAALFACALGAVVLLSGAAVRPTRAAVAGCTALLAYAVWTALSIGWSPAPSLARDDALLALLYAVAAFVVAVTVTGSAARVLVLGGLVLAAAATAVGAAAWIAWGEAPAEQYQDGRLFAPMGYWNAQAAFYFVAFWPALGLAASRSVPAALRVVALTAAPTLLAAWFLIQSKGAGVGLVAAGLLFLALARDRLRALVPIALALAVALPAFELLAEPFGLFVDQVPDAEFEAAIRDAGRGALLVSLAALPVALAYVLLDRRLVVPERAARAAGLAVAAAAVVAGVAAVVVAAVELGDPRDDVSDAWASFKEVPDERDPSSHLVNIGSNRYDFWRVALVEFRAHPVAGAGGRAFGAAYRREGATNETPQRAHALPLDVLAETGIVGFVLLAVGVGAFVVGAARRSRSSLADAALFAALAYWLLHASVDWLWTIPAAALPFVVLLGTGAAPDTVRPLGGRLTAPLAAGLVLVALLVFAPPWLSARLTDRAIENPGTAERDFRWARALDPLSVDPLVAESGVAPTAGESIPPLLEALEREPESAGVRYVLGLAYLDAGRPREALEQLREAQRLDPHEARVRDAVARAERAERG